MTLPLSMFGTAAAAGGATIGFPTNPIDASAPAWMREGNGTSPIDGGSVLLSLWFEAPAAGADRFIFQSRRGTAIVYDVSLYINATGNLVFERQASGATNTSIEAFTPGETYQLLFTATASAGSIQAYINDVAWSFDQDIGFWLSTASGLTCYFADRFERLQFFSPKVGDLWIDNSTLDLTVESNRRKFITADLQPVDLGANGQNPTGASPFMYFGGTQTAVNWNAAANLGTAADPVDGGTGWDSFTDA